MAIRSTLDVTSTQTPASPDPSGEHPGRRTLKELAYEAIYVPASRNYGITLKVVLVAILASIVILALETMHPLVDEYADVFHAVDLTLLAIFTLEYVLHLWVAPNRRNYALSLWGIVDLLAILPAYIELTLGGVASMIFLRQLRILRVMRMLKLLKLAAEQAALSAAQATEKKSSFLMDIQIYGICLFTVMTISSSLMYQFEGVSPGVPELTGEAVTALADAGKDGNETPEWFADPMAQIYAERAGMGWSNPVYTFTSVPKAYWWSIVTLTTTGYGDMFPVTMGGRIVAGLTMLAGLALFSLLTSVVGRALMTSLFGKGGDDEAPRTKVFVIGTRMPAGFNVADYIGGPANVPGGETMQPVARRSSDVGLLERPFLESHVSLRDITESASHVADSVVASTSEASELEASGMVIGPNSSWFDRLVYDSFVDHGSRLYEPVHRALTSFIFLSVVLVVLDSVDWVHDEYNSAFEVLETLIVFLFTFEFIANYRIAPRKLGYVFSLWGMIDLLAVIPTYVTLAVYILGFLGVPLSLTGGLLFKVLRMMRVLRMLRTLKLAKNAASNMQKTMSGSGSSFWTDLQIYLIALFTVLVISSTLIWNVEFDPLDEKSTTMFVNIPVSMWWGIVTLCTVGYGDMFPQTLAGRAIAGFTMLCGLALFGILTSVIGRALMASLFGTTDDDGGAPEVVYLDPPPGATPSVTGADAIEALRALGTISEAEYETMMSRVTPSTVS